MIMCWFYDGQQILIKDNKYYTKNFEWEELDQPYTTIQPPNCKKCKFDGAKWIILEENDEQIDSLTPIKTTEELTKENEHLWETIEFILKNTGFIPSEVI